MRDLPTNSHIISDIRAKSSSTVRRKWFSGHNSLPRMPDSDLSVWCRGLKISVAALLLVEKNGYLDVRIAASGSFRTKDPNKKPFGTATGSDAVSRTNLKTQRHVTKSLKSEMTDKRRRHGDAASRRKSSRPSNLQTSTL